MDEKLSRRDLFQQGAALSVLAVVGASACSKPKAQLACTEPGTLSAADAQVRVSLFYVDVAPDPTKMCVSCQQFLPGPQDACGTCKVLRGSINPAGYCRAFAPRTM
jgi:hypothetical protein